jgi:formamidopyrimidine-DNA glycosylase
MEGHRITRMEARRKDLRIPFPPRFVERVTGRKVVRLLRRAKYLLAELDSGETLIMHLGMSGRFTIYQNGKERTPGEFSLEGVPAEGGSGKHDHVVFETDAPARIVFSDHRRFGLMTLTETEKLAEHPLFKGMGIEPLSKEFDGAYLAAALKGKKAPMKAALLDQRIISGLGNIYVCEALHKARISPKRLSGTVKPERLRLLVPIIKDVLKEAVAAGGSTLRDYKQADGKLGYFQHRFSAYDREGARCDNPGCNGTIKRIVQSGRSTFYCPTCQK